MLNRRRPRNRAPLWMLVVAIAVLTLATLWRPPAPGDGGSAHAPTPRSPSPAPSADVDVPAGTHVPDYPGQPPTDTVLWGASIHGNGDPGRRHEQAAGSTLGIRRTYFQWNQRTTSLLNTATEDLVAGRLPWVSVKPPGWVDMATGVHDHEIDEMLRALDGLEGPVWLTVHHEPEGGGGTSAPDDPGGPEAHQAMNQRVRARMTALGVDNVALLPVLMAWTFTPGTGRDPDEWWAQGTYDLVGIDYYREDPSQMLDPVWERIRQWAAERDVDIAVGEWGVRGTDQSAARAVVQWYDAAVASGDDGQGARVVALSAFDSGLNSPNGSWELRGAQLDAFQQLLSASTSVTVADLDEVPR